MAVNNILNRLIKEVNNDKVNRRNHYTYGTLRVFFDLDYMLDLTPYMIIDNLAKTPKAKKAMEARAKEILANASSDELAAGLSMEFTRNRARREFETMPAKTQIENLVKKHFNKFFTFTKVKDMHKSVKLKKYAKGYEFKRNITTLEAFAAQYGGDITTNKAPTRLGYTIEKGSNRITIVYMSSMYGGGESNNLIRINNKRLSPSGSGDIGNRITKELIDDFNELIIDELTKASSVSGAKTTTFKTGLGKAFSGTTFGRTDLKQFHRSSHAGQRIRAHAEPTGQGGRVGGSDITDAMGTVLDVLQGDRKGVKDELLKAVTGKNRVVRANQLYESVVDEMMDTFFVDSDKLADITKLDDDYEFQMAVSHADVNKNQYYRADQKPILQRIDKVKKHFFKILSDPEEFGSRPVKDRLVAVTAKSIIQNMFTHRTKPDMRFKVNKALVADGSKSKNSGKDSGGKTVKGKSKKGGSKRSSPNPVPGIVSAVKVGGTAAVGGRGATTRVANKAAQNPLALRKLLNAVLPQQVARNMQAPRLRYRTGRFANSVTVDDVTTGPRGGNMIIQSSYQTDPYGTYAPGGKRYTPQRNPETLIKASIRQVATGIIGQRFNVKVDR